MRSLVLALFAVWCHAASLDAQPDPAAAADSASPAMARWHFGVSAAIGEPVGDFRRNVGLTAGANGHLRLRLDPNGIISLRLEGGYLNYGHESERICVASTPGCRVAVSVNTANGILSAGLGPEIAWPIGRLRAYGHALVGISRLTTFSTLGGGLLPDLVAADENFGDSGISWSTGAGVSLPIHAGLAIDFGVSYQGHGRRNYITKGGVTDNPDGSLVFDVRRSTVSLFATRLGVSMPMFRGAK